MKGGCKSSKPPCFPVSNVGELTDPELLKLPSILKESGPRVTKEEKGTSPLIQKDKPKSELEASWSVFAQEVIEPMRKQIRSGIPLLNHREIRRVRLPYYESILQDLKEDGFEEAEQYIRYLINLDENLRLIAGPQNIIFHRPPLKTSNNIIKKLVDLFKEDDLYNNATVLLKASIEFTKEDMRDWFWMAEDILGKAVGAAFSIESNERIQAIALHVQAEFLLVKLGKVNEAEAQLIKSMKLSSTRHWTAKEIYGTQCDLLYFDSCYLLHKVYLIQAKDVQITDVQKCIQLCKRATNLVMQTKHDAAKENAMLELIDAYIAADEDKHANEYVEKYLDLCLKRGNTEGKCKGMVKQSIILHKGHEIEAAKEILKSVIKEATKGKHKYLCAVAHQRLVILNLQQEDMSEAVNNAAIAYELFAELNALKECEEMRCLFIITMGYSTLQLYENILFNSAHIDDKDFDSFIQWKVSRKEFHPNMKLIQPEAERIAVLEIQYQQAKEEEAAYILKKVTDFNNSSYNIDSSIGDRQTLVMNNPYGSIDQRRTIIGSIPSKASSQG